MTETVQKKTIAFVGPDVINFEEESDISAATACLMLMGYRVAVLGLASDTSAAVERGAGDVGQEPYVLGYGLKELEKVEQIIVYKDQNLLEEINDLGIAVHPESVFLQRPKNLTEFTEAGVALLANNETYV